MSGQKEDVDKRREMGMPLAQIKPMKVNPKTSEAVLWTKEAIEDWHYWVAMGYMF